MTQTAESTNPDVGDLGGGENGQRPRRAARWTAEQDAVVKAHLGRWYAAESPESPERGEIVAAVSAAGAERTYDAVQGRMSWWRAQVAEPDLARQVREKCARIALDDLLDLAAEMYRDDDLLNHDEVKALARTLSERIKAGTS